MKASKILGIVAVTAAVLMAFVAAGTASATVLCKNNSSTTACSETYGAGTEIKTSLVAGTKSKLATEMGTIECGKSSMIAKSSNAGGSSETVKGSTEALTFEECGSHTITVLKKGSPEIHHIGGTDNGTVTSSGAEITLLTHSLFLGTTHCIYTTASTDLGTLTGGNPAKISVEAEVPAVATSPFCGEGATWTAEYEVTSPKPLYVASAAGGGGPAETTLTTSLSGEGKSGEKITVFEGAKVKDQATLSGANAASATGTIKYFVYSDSKCENLVTKAGESGFSEGKVPASEEKALEAGVYYWQAEYSGDSNNLKSTSTCGKEVLTVKVGEWSIQELPAVEGAQGFLYGVSCPSTELCFAVGNYLSESNNLIAERWNGKEWLTETLPTSGALAAISCSSTTSCVAVGYKGGGTQAISWNGSEWKTMTTPNPANALESFLEAVSCTSSTQCTATGWYQSKTEGRRTLVERWNGSEWVIQSSPSPGGGNPTSLTGVSCTSSTACMASGFYYTTTEIFPMAQQWDGTKWSAIEVPTPAESKEALLEAISCTSSTVCTAVGRSGSPGYTTLAERWNGTEWNMQSIPNPEGETLLYGVSCASSTACTTAGVNYISGELKTVVERWDGTEWELQPSPNVAGAEESLLFSISCPTANSCVAAGYTREKRAVGPASPLILRYE